MEAHVYKLRFVVKEENRLFALNIQLQFQLGEASIVADKVTYPRIPASNWWALRAQFAKTLPGAVTRTYLQTLLGLTPESANNLLPPLRQLGLIDDDGKPTMRANDWRTETKYEDACTTMVAEIYPQELRDLYNGPNIDRNGCKGWFKHTGKLGDAGASAVATMYILLNSGLQGQQEDGRKKRDLSKESVSKPRTINTPAAKTVPPTQSRTSPTNVEVPQVQASRATQDGPTLHIDLQIHIAPDASPDQIDAIFASMARHLYGKNER